MNTTTSPQHPIGSGFTAVSTVDDVIAGIDLRGKNVVITGGHVGLGLVTTRALSGAGATVTVASRSPERARAALTGVERVDVEQLDLADPDSVDGFVARYLARGRPLDILINNAGIMGGPLAHDVRGFESHLATNHLGSFQLTTGLLPALRAAGAAGGARVVTLTSGAHRLSDIRWDDPNFHETPYDWHLAYGQSKTANVLFTVELDRRHAAEGIRAYVLHPGIIIGTSLGPARAAGETASTPEALLREQGLIDDEGNPVIDPERGLKTPEQGASTTVFAATSPLLAGIGGVYLKDNDISEVDPTPQTLEFDGPPSTDVAPHAIDAASARRLWTLSEELLAGSR